MKNFFEKLNYYLFIRKSNWNYLFFLILISPIFIYIYYKNDPIKNGNYTIGYIYKIYWPVVNAKTIMYSYKIKNNEYKNTNEYNSEKKPEVGKRYLIQFSLEDLAFSHIFQDIPVPDSITESPPEGWEKLPDWAKKNK